MAIGDLVSRVYGSFRGADFRGDEVNLSRSPDCLNMWKDYKETESIRTRPGMVPHEAFTTPIWGIFYYEVGNTQMLIVHSGTKLYTLSDGVKTELYSGLNPRRSDAFIYNNIFYFKDGIHYLCYDGAEIKEVVGYIPTTSIGRRPSGGGTTHEDVNMLSDFRNNTFLADGESTEYYLDAGNISQDVAPEVRINGVVLPITEYTVDYLQGKITFDTAPSSPLTDGQDTVSVNFKKVTNGYRERIENCRLLRVFDNRVFFSGNPDYPNVVWHCSLNDPTYCSDLDYYNEGSDLAQVTGLVAGNNALWVFKEPSQANTTVFYHNPVVDADYGKIYPSVHSSVSEGCVGAAINFNDDIVFFSERGMEAINGDVTTEQVLAHRSALVDRKLVATAGYKDMVLAEWEGYLLVFIGNKAYLADSRGTLVNEGHAEYEWFYWEMEEAVTCAMVHAGTLYLGTAKGIYTLTGSDSALNSYWVTPLDKFKHPQYLKTSNKRGCVVEATGDLTIHVRTNKTEWEKIGDYPNITDYCVSRIKRKKFKDIQLKFSSETRFSLETATLECYIGGYIKR